VAAKAVPFSIDSSASFNAATKHLFRHLHEARALRKNPLVRRFFEDPEIGGLAGSRERAVLERIQALVRRAADECRDADLAAGNDERAVRLHAIVVLECLERRPMHEVAATLGLSQGYCYRERAAIYRRIARYFSEAETDWAALAALPHLDEFSVRIDRARQQAAFGDASGALHACDELVRLAPSPEHCIEALRTSANVSLEFAEPARAHKAYATAARLAAEGRAFPSPAREIIHASLHLMRHKLALYHADSQLALENARAAVVQLEPIPKTAHAGELYVEALYELGIALATNGDVERAYDSIAAAEANAGYLRPGACRLRSRITILIWRLRNHLLTSCKTWYPSQQRVNGLMGAFNQAYAAGLYCEAAAALMSVAEMQACSRRDEEALRASRLALLIADRHPNARLRAEIAIMVAECLRTTRHWRFAFSLLPKTDRLDACAADHRQLFAYLCAAKALRRGEFHNAWSLAEANEERSEYAALTVSRRLIGASAAHELERRRDAYALVEAAIPAAERIGAPLLRDAFSVAAKVTGEIRYEHRANEVSRLLTV
jgi:hypothetical protein